MISENIARTRGPTGDGIREEYLRSRDSGTAQTADNVGQCRTSKCSGRLRRPRFATFGEQARCGERRRPPAVERARGASRPSGAGSDSGTSSTAVCGARRRQARPHRGRGSSTWLASHARARMRQCPRSPRSRSKTSAASRSCGSTG